MRGDEQRRGDGASCTWSERINRSEGRGNAKEVAAEVPQLDGRPLRSEQTACRRRREPVTDHGCRERRSLG